MPPTLSKSRYQSGLQCLKRLYLESYHIELADPVEEGLQARFDVGTAVGELARQRWRGGRLIEEPYNEHGQAVATTQALLAAPAPPALFEAAFFFENIRVRVDILAPNGRGGFDLVEVKSVGTVRPYHVTDAAIQAYVVEGAGVSVDRVFVMRLNKGYVYQGGEHDLEQLFTLEDVTDDARSFIAEDLPANLASMWEVLSIDAPPMIETGLHCTRPYRCPFFAHCHRDEPEHPTRELPRLADSMWLQLKESGIHDIAAIPPDFPQLNALQRRVRESVISWRPFIAQDLGPKLRNIAFPASFLDFETVMPTVPIYVGTRPFQVFPFQWSLHVRDAQGNLEHREFLNPDMADPRERFVSSLLDALPAEGDILAYSGYEGRILRELAEAFPAHRDRLLALIGRIVDLLALVREGYYHPEFHGSFSLKSVLPALVPEFGYGDLQIRDGQAATAAYLRMVAHETPDGGRAELHESLLDYCRRDTEAMIRIYDALLSEYRIGQPDEFDSTTNEEVTDGNTGD